MNANELTLRNSMTACEKCNQTLIKSNKKLIGCLFLAIGSWIVLAAAWAGCQIL